MSRDYFACRTRCLSDGLNPLDQEFCGLAQRHLYRNEIDSQETLGFGTASNHRLTHQWQDCLDVTIEECQKLNEETGCLGSLSFALWIESLYVLRNLNERESFR